jgi:hypothetical protein
MIKQISTYGAALLTVMVIVRAATIDDKLDLSDRYQRSVDLTYVEDNLALRYDYAASTSNSMNLLAFNTKPVIEITAQKINPRPASVNRSNSAIDKAENNAIEIDPIDLELLVEEAELAELAEKEDLSLDRESTINSGLSVIFNRERIHPKPTRIALQD